MSKRVNRKYTTEFRESAVNMVISSEKSMSQIAKELGINGTTLYAWVNKAKSTTTHETGKNTEQLFDELKRLKIELSDVREQRDILKKATAYFAKESR